MPFELLLLACQAALVADEVRRLNLGYGPGWSASNRVCEAPSLYVYGALKLRRLLQ